MSIWWLISGLYLAQWRFNHWATCRGWLARFGELTRAESFSFAIMAAVPIAGTLIALSSLADPALKSRWSRFWNTQVLP